MIEKPELDLNNGAAHFPSEVVVEAPRDKSTNGDERRDSFRWRIGRRICRHGNVFIATAQVEDIHTGICCSRING